MLPYWSFVEKNGQEEDENVKQIGNGQSCGL